MPKKVDRSIFANAAVRALGSRETISRKEIVKVCDDYNVEFPNWLTQNSEFHVARGVYVFPLQYNTLPKSKVTMAKTSPEKETTAVAMAPVLAVAPKLDVSYVPETVRGYVPFGHFNDVRAIVRSKRFYPVFVTGLSGNGKTMMIDQTCSAEKREMIRVNITIETDEDDLLGGFRLVDGKTVWHNGPVVTAMERGAILLLDEVDLGSNKLMCLQPVLEGKAVFLKKIGKVITPAPGFNIIATANTKGKGSDDGRFIGTNVLNEAFLERFSITMEQEYPSNKIESKILNNVMRSAGVESKEFVDLLIRWAEVIRKSFYDGAVSEIISTRRLVHICEAFAIFGQNREKAITLCLNRFDSDTKKTFLDFYAKIDESLRPLDPAQKKESEEIAF